MAEIVNLFDDIEKGLGAFIFVLDTLGGFMGGRQERLIVGTANNEQQGVEFFFWREIEFADKRPQFF